MKKLRFGLLLLVSCLFLSGCGCEKETKNYTVTFNSNGGSAVESQTVKENGLVTKPTDPTKEGYTFSGWYLDLNDNDAYDFSTKVTKNITLYAKWSDGKPVSGDDDKKCTLTCDAGYKLNEDACKCEKDNTTTKTVKVKSVSLNTTSANLVVGETLALTAKINPTNATDKKVVWKSSDEKVATVKNGKVTAVGKGSATITATVGGKSATVTINVKSKDEVTLNNALASMKAKSITKGNTDINYTYSGCTITNTGNRASNSTTVSIGKVNTLYRDTTNASINSTYNVVCGTESATKTLKHTIPASTYGYIASYDGIKFIIRIDGATNYVLSSDEVKGMNYVSGVGGVQTGVYKEGTVFKMVFNNDANTIYQVKSNY